MNHRIGRLLGLVGLGIVLLNTSDALAADCRTKATSKAASMFSGAFREFEKCSRAIASNGTCSTALRDAKVQTKLSLAVQALTRGCETAGAGFGFSSDAALAQRVIGVATGEARQVADAVYGRDAVPTAANLVSCAKLISKQLNTAGKKYIKTLMKCGGSCTAADTTKANAAYVAAEARINKRCAPGDITTLVGTLSAHSTQMKLGAQRVVNSLTPGANPVVVVVSPTAGSVITPPSLPALVPVSANVSGVPHKGYVIAVDVNNQGATYNSTTTLFDRTISVDNPPSNYAIPLRARTYLGAFVSATNVKFNLGTLAPDVVINAPATGTITSGSSIVVSGQVLGDLTKASVLLVGGQATSFNPTTGAFSTSVSLGSPAVQVLEARVQSFSLGTENTDSIIVLKGNALPLSSRVPNGNTNRLNNSGFTAIKNLILSELTGSFSPAAFIGMQVSGGTITEFSTGTIASQLFAAGPHAITLSIDIPTFHLKVSDIDSGILGITCTLTYDATNLNIFYSADLVPLPPIGNGMQANTNSLDTTFSGSNANLSGGFLGICSLASLVVDVEGMLETEFGNQIQNELPVGLNQTLAGINVAGPIGEALNVNIDAVYNDIAEDADGITFKVDSNVIALSPAPDAPPITQTLSPVPSGPPVLGPTVPGSGYPYDLAFCLSDGFINRFMAAFMIEGNFNQLLTEIPDPLGGPPIPLTTALLSFLFADPAYYNACPGPGPAFAGCPVALQLRPSVAAVARPPVPGEDGDVVLIVPNYRFDAIADDGGPGVPLIASNLTFELPISLGAGGSTISPAIGTLSISNFKVTSNPIGADEDALAAGVVALFPQAASALGGLFATVPLPPFQGLQLYGVGSGYNVSCTALYLSFSPPPPTPTRTPTRTFTASRTPTITGTPTNTPLVSSTPTQTPTRTPTKTPSPTITPGGTPAIGQRTLTLQSGSVVNLQSELFKITFNLSGTLDIQFGAPDTNGIAPVVIPQEGVHFNPINVVGIPGVVAACVSAIDDGSGIIDCDGGATNRDFTTQQDHNTTPGNPNNSGSAAGLPDDPTCDDTRTWPDGSVDTACMEGDACAPTATHGVCNSPVEYLESGVFGAGALRVKQTVSITTLATNAEKGVDGLPCTSDDTPSGAGGATTVFFTTGTATGKVFDRNNVLGAKIAPGETCGGSGCVAQLTGTSFDCTALSGGSFNGATMVTAFVGLDSQLGDVVTTLKLVSQP